MNLLIIIGDGIVKNILPIQDSLKNSNYTCFEVMIIKVCQYFNIEYHNMFAWRWSFEYNLRKKHKNIYYHIDISKDIIEEDRLFRKYLGLRMKGFKFNKDKFKNIVYSELKKEKPIGILIDAYWCPWNPSYKKFHINHFCLVIGQDDFYYYLCDPYIVEGITKIVKAKANMFLIKLYLIFFREKQQKFLFEDFIKESFEFNCYYKKKNNMFDNLNKYSNILKDSTLSDLVSEEELLNIKISSTLRIIKSLGDERTGLYNLFEKNKNKISFESMCLLEKIIRLWKTCLNMHLRLFINKDINKKLYELGDIFFELSKIEEKFYINVIKKDMG